MSVIGNVIGFVINPIAGMGGRVGLKGTDDTAEEAARRGAVPLAGLRALEALQELAQLLRQHGRPPTVRWLTCTGAMGFDALIAAGLGPVEPMLDAAPSAQATRDATTRFVAAKVDLILFCGGDGTARDVCSVVGTAIPVLGIPAGVKMYSGVFGITPRRTAEICHRFLVGEIGTADVEVLDLDEERYRHGEWVVRLHMTARSPFEPHYVQAAKAIITARDDDAVKDDIAVHVIEEIEADPDGLVLLGPGSTLATVGRALGIDKTLLGINALAGGRLIGKDLDEQAILALLDRYPRCRLILSPIGAQGFVLGRGNQQLSPAVLRRVGTDNIVVVATPAKLARTPVLRFDSGDPALDAQLLSRRFIPVVIGYRRARLVRVAG